MFLENIFFFFFWEKSSVAFVAKTFIQDAYFVKLDSVEKLCDSRVKTFLNMPLSVNNTQNIQY